MQTTVIARDLPEVTGIFEDIDTSIFTKYRVELTFIDRVMGGVPQKPEIIEAWLRQRITGGDEEVYSMFVKTLDELGVDVKEGMTPDELHEAARKVAREQHGNTFYRDSKGLFLGDYQLKASAKESTAIQFPYPKTKMGDTRKAARSYLAERVFVDSTRVHLNRMEPDGTHLHIGHPNTPRGKISTLTYYDYCESSSGNLVTAEAVLCSLEDCIDQQMWGKILTHMQRNGLGALRSLGYGTYKVTAFDKL